MGEGSSQSQQQHQLMLQPQQRPRFGVRSTAGEIVEVQGGHIVRSTGRKDRHSKVCTAKGPRDRRVRLSAHTAIQFYDVQDRLGYDRPSKAVDWLIKNAKAAIDELAELPAWHPTATVMTATASTALHSNPQPQGESSCSSRQLQAPEPVSSSRYTFGSASAAAAGGSSSFLPPSLDSDAIADTIKSFFPMAAAAPAATAPTDNSPIEFHNYPPHMLSRSSGQNQDLRLSLQSFTDPMFHQQQQQQQNPNAASHHVLFSSFDAASATAVGMIPWNVPEASEGVGNVGGGGGGGGYVFNVPLQQQQQQAVAMQHQMMLGQVPGQFFTQRGPLQSSNPPFVRAAWMDPMAVAAAAADPSMHSVIHHPSLSSIGFASGSRGSGGFSGFHIPARIQGEEEHDGLSSDRPSSDSSGSHH